MGNTGMVAVFIADARGEFQYNVSTDDLGEALTKALDWFNDPHWQGPKPARGTILKLSTRDVREDVRVSVLR